MATASRHLCRAFTRLSSCQPVRRKSQPLPRRSTRHSPFRSIATTPSRFAERQDGESSKEPDFDENGLQKPADPYTVNDLDPDERATFETMSKPEQTRYLAIQNHVKAVMESEEMAEASHDQAAITAREIDRSIVNEEKFLEERNLQALKDGFWQEDEDDEFGQVPDDDDEATDDLITSVAESELELHREVREYTRLAAWDLPLLLQFTKPFHLPSMYRRPLRFRYTTYMGESHPAQKKVVVEFTTRELAHSAGLSEAQRIKLIKLVGVRYNPDQDTVKMSCEKFENAAQNKRYLGDVVGKIVAEAKDEIDTFEDVPLDFRHHKPKRQNLFPESWKVGSKRGIQRLVQQRQGMRLLEEGEKIVDGQDTVEMWVRKKTVSPASGMRL